MNCCGKALGSEGTCSCLASPVQTETVPEFPTGARKTPPQVLLAFSPLDDTEPKHIANFKRGSAQTPRDAKDLVTSLDSTQELLTLGRDEK